MASSDSLSARWQRGDGPVLAERVLARLVVGGPVDDLPLDRHEGRVDLRGFRVPKPEAVGNAELIDAEGTLPGVGVQWLSELIEMRGVSLTDIDLSGAQVAHLRFFDSVLCNCRFDQADCRDWRGWNLVVDDCTFGNADLGDSALGTWYEQKGNRYSSVDFSGADLRGAVCEGASFVDCTFAGTRLDKVEFAGCEFVRCRFSGMLDEVRFLARALVTDKDTPGRLAEVDFSGATLRRVEFKGFSLNDASLPGEGDAHAIVHHYPCVVRRAVAELDEDLSPEVRRLRSLMRTASQRLDDAPEVGIWHVDELGQTTEQQRRARDLLHRLDRECADG